MPRLKSETSRRTDQLRAAALTLAGGKCARCPATSELQVHLLHPDGGIHHKFGSFKRWRFYYAALTAKTAIVLCRSCHSIETTRELRLARVGVRATALLDKLQRPLRPASPGR